MHDEDIRVECYSAVETKFSCLLASAHFEFSSRKFLANRSRKSGDNLAPEDKKKYFPYSNASLYAAFLEYCLGRFMKSGRPLDDNL